MCVRQELSYGSTMDSDSVPIATKDHRETVKIDEYEILQEDIFSQVLHMQPCLLLVEVSMA